MRQPACLVFNSIVVDFYAGSGISSKAMTPTQLFVFVGKGRSFLSVARPTGVQLVLLVCSRCSVILSPASGQHIAFVSPRFRFIIVFI